MRILLTCDPVARNALKRKKQHEHSLEQTNGQISMLEQQIYSIESANINQETLVAMKNAGAAMKQIHGKMTMEDVDVTMYVTLYGCDVCLLHCSFLGLYDCKRLKRANTLSPRREQLREQHELTQEIGNAITSMPITEPIDEDELQNELEKMEQEALDEKMLKTGTVPVADSLNRLPAGPNGDSKLSISYFLFPYVFFFFLFHFLDEHQFPSSLRNTSRINIPSPRPTTRIPLTPFHPSNKRQIKSPRRGRRRGSRTRQATSRNGNVSLCRKGIYQALC